MIERVAFGGKICAGKTEAAEYLIGRKGFTLLGFATPLYELGEIHERGTPENAVEWFAGVSDWMYRYLFPLGYGFTRRSQFKRMVLDVFERVEPTPGEKNRTLLQLLGTEVGRVFDEDLWVRLFERNLGVLPPGARVVQDNLRFPNEFDASERLGFVTVLIEAPEEVREARYRAKYGRDLTPEEKAHPSEAYLDELAPRFAHRVSNGGTPEELYRQLDGVLAYSFAGDSASARPLAGR